MPLRKVRRLLASIKETSLLGLANDSTRQVFGVEAAKTSVARLLQKTRHIDRNQNEFAERIAGQGFVVVENFLPESTFNVVKSEAFSLLDADEQENNHTGCNEQSKVVDLLEESDEFLPGLYGYLQNEELGHMIQSIEGRKIEPLSGRRVLERLCFGEKKPEDGGCQLYADTFFHSHEAWLFLEDVGEDNGALVYVPKSHRYNLCQMKFQYLEGSTSKQGARPISQKELKESGLKKTVVSAKANTLVVFNSAGYHCRLNGNANTRRLAIHTSYRTNPLSRDVS